MATDTDALFRAEAMGECAAKRCQCNGAIHAERQVEPRLILCVCERCNAISGG